MRKKCHFGLVRMEAQLRAIQAGVNKAENDLNGLVDALRGVGDRWRSVQVSFDDHPDQLSSFAEFPDLRSKLELEHLSICDSLIAGMSPSLLMLEHAITNGRAAFAKAKQTLKSKDLAEPWSFPPGHEFIGDLFRETESVIEHASGFLERFRLGLYNLHNLHESITPDSVSEFVNYVS